MCFSATASFTAGVTLSILGVAALYKTEQSSELPFAMIPLLFGIQQFVEGMLWLSFRFDVPLLKVAMTYAFISFSHVLWPIFIPLSIGLVESIAWRKKAISTLLIAGIAIGLYNLYIIVLSPVTSEVNCQIVYVSSHVDKITVLALYLAAVCGSSLVSSHKIINILGVLTFLFFMVAYWFYTTAYYSVWCYFAAILSVVIYLHFKFRNAPAPDQSKNLA